jgi:hypothetical protein
MSADNFTGQNISSTFQRLLQLSDNGNGVTDGTGSLVTFLPIDVNNALTASYVSGVTAFSSASLLITASVSLNTITFTKGNNSQFSLTIDTGSNSGGPESDPIFTAKSASLATTGSNTFIGNQTIYAGGNGLILGGQEVYSTNEIGLYGQGDNGIAVYSIDLSQYIYGAGLYRVDTNNYNNSVGDVHRFTGSVSWNSGATGSLYGTSSYAQTTSYVNQLNQDVLISGSLTVLDTDNYNVFTAGNGETSARNLDVQSRLRVSSDSTGRGRIIVEELSAGVVDTIYNPTTAALIATSGSVKMSGSISITGSLDVSGSFGLFTRGTTPPTGTPSRVGLFYFTDTDLYISLQ